MNAASREKLPANMLLNDFCKEDPVTFFLFQNSLGPWKILLHLLNHFPRPRSCRISASLCNTKVALNTSSLPLACVCGPVTIAWSQSIQVSHYPRLLTIPFMSIHCCWGVRWRTKGTKRDWATSLLCKKVGPNIVGLLILQEYSSLITCKAIYTKHVN